MKTENKNVKLQYYLTYPVFEIGKLIFIYNLELLIIVQNLPHIAEILLKVVLYTYLSNKWLKIVPNKMYNFPNQ